MKPVFLCGPLADPALLSVVLGDAGDRALAAARPASLPGHRLGWRAGARVAAPQADARAQVPGILLEGLDLAGRRRLNHFLSGVAKWGPVRVTLDETAGARPASGAGSANKAGLAGLADAQAPLPEAPQDAAASTDFAPLWASHDWPAVMAAAAAEYMDSFDRHPALWAHERWPVMLMRAASQVRAGASEKPATRRLALRRDAVDLRRCRRPYSDYFTIEEMHLSFPRFDGSPSPVVKRATFVDGDAITVLPYDPVRDRLMLVEQFRMGPYVRGEPRPWMLEAVAGRIDPGESPADAARRELAEETGLQVGEVMPVASYYPSSGAVTGYFYSYVALCDLPDGTDGVHGLDSEAEDIRSHLVGFDEAMALVASGEAEAGPLILTLFWLEHRRAGLRPGA